MSGYQPHLNCLDGPKKALGSPQSIPWCPQEMTPHQSWPVTTVTAATTQSVLVLTQFATGQNLRKKGRVLA